MNGDRFQGSTKKEVNVTASAQLSLEKCPSSVVAETYTARQVPVKDGSTVPMDVYIPREQGDYLYSMVREIRPATSLEVGMANGLSTLFIAQALAENGNGRHIAIDPFQHGDW